MTKYQKSKFKYKLKLGALLVAIISLLFNNLVIASGGKAVLALYGASETTVGSTIDITVRLQEVEGSGASTVAGYLRWDTNFLDYVSSSGATFNANAATPLFAWLDSSGSNPITTSADIVTVRFRAKRSGATTISVENRKTGNANNQLLSVDGALKQVYIAEVASPVQPSDGGSSGSNGSNGNGGNSGNSSSDNGVAGGSSTSSSRSSGSSSAANSQNTDAETDEPDEETAEQDDDESKDDKKSNSSANSTAVYLGGSSGDGGYVRLKSAHKWLYWSWVAIFILLLLMLLLVLKRKHDEGQRKRAIKNRAY